MTRGPREVDRVGDMREVLTATGAGIYLATHVAGPMPAETMTAVRESDDLELRIGRAGPDRADDLEQREKEARAVVAAAIHASPDAVALTHGAADGMRVALLDLVARRGRDERRTITTGEGLETSVAVAVEGVAHAAGMTVEIAHDDPSLFGPDVLAAAVPHVDGRGRRADVGALVAAARDAGVVLIIDVSLALGAADIDVTSEAPDIVVADGHRWLLGPEGTGLVWVSPALDEEAPERLRRQTGVSGRGPLLGLARSVGWLLMYIELPWVVHRTIELGERLYEGLGAIEGLELAASDAHGALAAFAIDGWTAAEAVEELSRGVFAIVDVDAKADLVRASVGAWTREDEIDRFVGQVAEIAAHTPDTYPRKPSLTVISGPVDPDG